MPKRAPHTPLLDAWRERLHHATAGYGLKSELARHMAALRNQPFRTWTVNVSRYLRTTQSPNAEDLLAITEWMDSRTD
jgi:hypothetical protein